jgi:hypothetical protein
MDTSAGIFARLAAEAVAKQLEPPTLLALLKASAISTWAARRARSGTRLKHSNWRCCAAPARKREAPDWRATSTVSALSLRN